MTNSRSLDDLLPSIKPHAIMFLAYGEMELARRLGETKVQIKVTSTFRDEEYQNHLYAKGRTAPGNKVTNAKGGESWHNWRCAWDVMVLINGVVTWHNKVYEILGEVAKELGITWGGDFDGDGNKDREDWDLVHFQMTGGLTLAQLRAGEVPRIA